ncbi:MAG TPA: hypothetical protein DDY58_13085 [Terrisporobacter glycolicus]|uniref:hypothetical protein n=1 Tax=Terrisporobacter hibernicus TaxID=2813371 RepID=UPI000E7E2BCA|nr:hypothetical protein [Terrisporobacter hibernicus]HBI93265.1 hypothetical protein [Terrisporobacter hibernicus]
MLQIYEITVIILSIIIAIYSVKKSKRSNKSIYFIYLVFWFIYVLPLMCDLIIGKPNYGARFNGFRLSYDDEYTRFFYATYILVVQFIMLIVGNKKYVIIKSKVKYKNDRLKEIKNTEYKDNRIIENILLFFSILTVLLVIIFPVSKYILLDMSWRDSGKIIEGLNYYSTIERFSYISIVSCIICLFNKKYSMLLKVVLLIVLYMTICSESKRSIIFFAGVILIAYMIYNTEYKKRKNIYLLAYLGVIAAIMYSVYIKLEFRGYVNSSQLYTTMRIDFGRDDTVKLVIYSLLNPNKMKILDYPGQSIICQIGTIFPLQLLGVKSIGYNAFLTAALIGQPVERSINWMTTSILDETIANYGFWGFWIAPVIIGLMARVTDKLTREMIPITIGAIVLLLMYPISYIMWYLQFWLILMLIAQKCNKEIDFDKSKIDKE